MKRNTDDRGRKKGSPKVGGRSKGSRNVLSTDVKRELLIAFEELGGKEFLVRLANDQPGVFANLIGKLIPQEQTVSVTHNINLGAAMTEAEARLKTIEHEPSQPFEIEARDQHVKWPGYE